MSSWFQIKDEWSNPMYFYVLPSTQCDAETLQDIHENRRQFTYQALSVRCESVRDITINLTEICVLTRTYMRQLSAIIIQHLWSVYFPSVQWIRVTAHRPQTVRYLPLWSQEPVRCIHPPRHYQVWPRHYQVWRRRQMTLPTAAKTQQLVSEWERMFVCNTTYVFNYRVWYNNC